jgi:hypothetical protein
MICLIGFFLVPIPLSSNQHNHQAKKLFAVPQQFEMKFFLLW